MLKYDMYIGLRVKYIEAELDGGVVGPDDYGKIITLDLYGDGGSRVEVEFDNGERASIDVMYLARAEDA